MYRHFRHSTAKHLHFICCLCIWWNTGITRALPKLMFKYWSQPQRTEFALAVGLSVYIFCASDRADYLQDSIEVYRLVACCSAWWRPVPGTDNKWLSRLGSPPTINAAAYIIHIYSTVLLTGMVNIWVGPNCNMQRERWAHCGRLGCTLHPSTAISHRI